MESLIHIDKVFKNLHTEFMAKNIIYLKNIDSTNNFASGLIKEKSSSIKYSQDKKILHNGTVVIAGMQYKGRGRHGREWLSPDGGLWFTIILSPFSGLTGNAAGETAGNYDILPKITIIAAASVFKILYAGNYINSKNEKIILKNFRKFLYIKWPNDIYHKNCKISGILSETEKVNDVLYLIIGIGINANFTTRDKLPHIFNSVSLSDIFNEKVKREVLFAEIINNFEQKYLHYLKKNDLKSVFTEIEKVIRY